MIVSCSWRVTRITWLSTISRRISKLELAIPPLIYKQIKKRMMSLLPSTMIAWLTRTKQTLITMMHPSPPLMIVMVIMTAKSKTLTMRKMRRNFLMHLMILKTYKCCKTVIFRVWKIWGMMTLWVVLIRNLFVGRHHLQIFKYKKKMKKMNKKTTQVMRKMVKQQRRKKVCLKN